MDEYLDVEEACVKGRSGQFVHGDMDGDREEGATCLTCSPIFLGSCVGSLPLWWSFLVSLLIQTYFKMHFRRHAYLKSI